MKINNTHIFVKELLEKDKKYNEISEELRISVGNISKINSIDINLKEYEVKRAVIWAAGWGSRLMPVTKNTPKPLVSVKGVQIIESAVVALKKSGINDITIVVGRMKESFDDLLKKYDLKSVYNEKWEHHNNISSFYAYMKEQRSVESTYFIDGDLFIDDSFSFNKHIANSFLITSYSDDVNDLVINKKNKWIHSYINGAKINEKIAGEQYKGIFCLTKKDLNKLKLGVKAVYRVDDEYNDKYWFDPLFNLCSEKEIQMETKEIPFESVVEIDSLEDLVLADKETYKSVKHIKETY